MSAEKHFTFKIQSVIVEDVKLSLDGVYNDRNNMRERVYILSITETHVKYCTHPIWRDASVPMPPPTTCLHEEFIARYEPLTWQNY